MNSDYVMLNYIFKLILIHCFIGMVLGQARLGRAGLGRAGLGRAGLEKEPWQSIESKGQEWAGLGRARRGQGWEG